jgi:regulator of sigma E protease
MLIVLLVIVGLSVLILAHEASHFFFAKIFGLKVDEFGFGFPPRIFAWGKGETKYSLNWVPFGGFVKIAGERGEFEMMQEEEAGSPPSKGELEGVRAKTATVGSDFALSRTPPNLPLKGEELAVSDSRVFFAQPAWKKSVIILAGVAMNFVLGWFLISGALMIGTPKAVVITGVEAGSPAATVGIQAGDALRGYTTSADFIAYVNAHRGQPISFDVLRNAKDIQITVTPRVTAPPNQGAVGVALADAGSAAEVPLAALGDGFWASISMFGAIVVALGALVGQLFAHGSLPTGVVGPVGIFGVAQETGKIGLIYLLQFIGVISINLAAVNLIPFPALDGGRFIMILIEKIKGSAVPQKIEAWVNGLGFAFLLLLMLLLTVRDVLNLW